MEHTNDLGSGFDGNSNSVGDDGVQVFLHSRHFLWILVSLFISSRKKLFVKPVNLKIFFSFFINSRK